MCGIAGVIAKNSDEVRSERLKSMTDVIAHRGPDGDGCWISEDGRVGLAHRRLSIIDLSHEADQPMHYMDRYSLVFNGEIYNYPELKETLIKQGYSFRTQSDTEVLMALYDRDKEECLQLLDGMFAFVLYDHKEHIAFCARDRFGEKPFFYHFEKGKRFVFGSEMKCLWAGGIDKSVNGRMMFNYLCFAYLENPQDLCETFFNHCTRLPHSHYIILNTQTLELRIQKYYDIDWTAINHTITVEQAKERFHDLFLTSVQRRLRSDVPVGSSLSGGLDSSLIVCVIDELKKGRSQKQSTFSAVFPGFKKDERRFMDMVIAQASVNPHFVTPTEEGLINDLETLSWHQEEPYGSASIYAQFCVMRLAKEHQTTVLLDGQGADEILAGYHAYYLPFFNGIKKDPKYSFQLAKYNELHSANPINGITKKGMGAFIRSVSPALVKPAKRVKTAIEQRLSPSLNSDFYRTYRKEVFETPGHSFDSLNESLYSSTLKYGIQQLLRYADRNSMAHSREVRLPFLNHDLVEFLFSLPETFKMNEGWTKWIMRKTFEHTLPQEIAWRVDKIGYEPPQQRWMQNKQILDRIRQQQQKLIAQGFLDKKMADKVHPSTEQNWRHWMGGSIL